LFSSWGNPTARDVYKALINTGVLYGRITKQGVRVSASWRTLAVESGVGGRKAVNKSLTHLEENGLIRKVSDGSPSRAKEYMILTQSDPIINRVNSYGAKLSQTRRIRNPSRYYKTIGKRCGQILDYVYGLQRVVTFKEIADLIGGRPNNIKARYIKRLLARELLIEKDGGYITPDDIEDSLERILEEDGITQAEKKQRDRYEEQRRLWRMVEQKKPTVLIKDYQEPTVQKEMVKNIPALSADGIVYHTPECNCWLCDEDAPEFVEKIGVSAA
jgi:hypothetical protein